MKKLITEINTILQENFIIYPNQNLLCTVSSGQDSLLLFLVFLHLRNQWDLHLGLVYCHHFWQKTNFFSFWQIWKIAFLFDLPCFIVLTERRLSTENQARNWRQKSLERVTVLQNFSEITFGHTGSDKLETALWNLIRGTSPNGLNSIQQKTLSKRSFVQIFFAVNSITCFKPHKEDFQTKKQFFYRLNSRKNSFGLWLPPRKFFHLSQKISLINKQISFLYFGVLVNTFLIQRENSENIIPNGIWEREIWNFKKEKKYFNFSILSREKENFLFFSFCLKKMSVSPVLKKIRPLTTLHREDILKFTEYYFLPIIPDPTNAFSFFSRTKLRNLVLPVIRYLFSPKFDLAFNQFLKLLETESCDSEYSLKKIYQAFVKTVCFFHLQNSILFFPEFSLGEKSFQQNKKFLEVSYFEKKNYLSRLLRSHFKKLPISVQSKIIKKIFFYYSSSQLNYTQIETLRFLIISKKAKKKTHY